jgi:hypothetical protein
MYAIPITHEGRLEEPELTADDLLAWVAKDPECPHHSKSQAARRRFREKPSGTCEEYPAPVRAEAVIYLRASNLKRAISAAKLTGSQEQVFRARVRGVSYRDIGGRFGYTKQCAFRTFCAALRKVRRAVFASPLMGLASVYKQEVSRYAPSRIGKR